jgi:uncharacterized glyoxalase superfamily protein PhnB
MTPSDASLLAAVPVMPVEDFSAAVAFYRDVLGFTPTFMAGEYGGVERGSVELHLDAADPTTRPGVGVVTVRIAVDRIEDLYAELEPTGSVDPAEPLRDTPWGTTQFSVRDNCGNRITFARA